MPVDRAYTPNLYDYLSEIFLITDIKRFANTESKF